MIKVKKIVIENFRGIKLPLTLDFYKGGSPTSVIIYGRNGTGKSSIVDAWEWLVNHEISSLVKEGISTKDYPHKSCNGNNSYINIEFNHPTIKTAIATFNKTKITTPTLSGDYLAFKPYTVYPNYLRYSDLQEFVYLTKTDKYKYIAKFFGLEKFTKNQSDIQASVNRISSQLQILQGELKKAIDSINAITAKKQVDDATVLEYLNAIANKYKISAIDSFKKGSELKEALEKIVNANPIALEINEWTAFQARLNQFYPISKVKEDCDSLEKKFKELKESEEDISQLFLSELYKLGIETIDKLEDKGVCPLCDETYHGDLVHHLTNKHRALAELTTKKNDYDSKRNILEVKFQSILKKTHAIESENGVHVLEVFKGLFLSVSEISKEFPMIINTLQTSLKDLEAIEISTKDIVDVVDTISSDEVQNKKIVADKLIELSRDENTKDLATDFANIVQLIGAYTEYLKCEAKVSYLQAIYQKLNALFDSLTEYIQNEIQNAFSTIQTDVIDCYNVLESTNTFLKNPEINLVAGKDKAVELTIEFITEKISPAYKFMSESQVNSFGLAIFLSAVKHFNKEFKFIILDDVVNSFDSFKRPKVAQLLASRFSDFQTLILTHDQIFFDTVQKAFPNWQRYKFASWDFANGPKCKLSKSYAEDIQNLIDEDEPIKAGQTLGRYLEWMLGILNESMQTPIRYKVENVYTLAEFYDPLVARLKDKLKSASKTHVLIQLFQQFEQGTIFRNYCSHWKNEATQFTCIEIEAIFKKWIEIENYLYCMICKSHIQYEKNGSEYVKCSCSQLDLKASTHYN